ncbi:MAG: glutamate--tRNA ligase [Bacteroidia bacterium]|nr:glutamate--tRNA ligase [Bacteroidia bacterium]
MVVVRFAPSPTGPLHIGGVRTALYNYLFARQQNGRFILRIEDTDRARFVPGAEEYILESLEWLGINFTEGVGTGGENGPYRQSERAEIGLYKQFVDQLISSGKAYYAFDTPEELDAMREELKDEHSDVQQYNHATRQGMKNSFTLSPEEVNRRIQSGEPYVVRMDMPADEEVSFQDVVRDTVTFNTNQLDDKVLIKSDGIPTYHLANVVDDHLMAVTHVIRGEEWLSSTPLHVLLYRAFGWEDTMPVFVHLPLLLNPNGKGKLSKRNGDKMGFPVFPVDWNDAETNVVFPGFREAGYDPAALINFLALLGWNPGNDEEVMDINRLIELFSLDRIGSAGAKFDLEKLNWFNEIYLRKRSPEELLPQTKIALTQAGITLPDDPFLIGMIGLMRERVKFVREFATEAPYFFHSPIAYDEKMAKKWTAESAVLLAALAEKFEPLAEWNAEILHHTFQELLTAREVGAGKVMTPLRLALTGTSSGPGVFEIAALLGKEETQKRIKTALETIPV